MLGLIEALRALILYNSDELEDDLSRFIIDDIDKEQIKEMIINITAILHNIRHCDKKLCKCSPEFDLYANLVNLRSSFDVLDNPKNISGAVNTHKIIKYLERVGYDTSEITELK